MNPMYSQVPFAGQQTDIALSPAPVVQSVKFSEENTASGREVAVDLAAEFAKMSLEQLAAQSALTCSLIDKGAYEMRDHWDDLGAILVRARELFPSTHKRAEWVASAGLDRFTKDERAKAAWWHLHRKEVECSGKVGDRATHPVSIYQAFVGITDARRSSATSSIEPKRMGRPPAETLKRSEDGRTFTAKAATPATPAGSAEILGTSAVGGGYQVRGKSGEIHDNVNWTSIPQPLRDAYNAEVEAHNARIHAEFAAAHAPTVVEPEAIEVKATEVVDPPPPVVDPELIAQARAFLVDLFPTPDSLTAALRALQS